MTPKNLGLMTLVTKTSTVLRAPAGEFGSGPSASQKYFGDQARVDDGAALNNMDAGDQVTDELNGTEAPQA